MLKNSRSKSVDNYLKNMDNNSLSMQGLKSDVDNLKLEVIRFSKETSDSIQDSKYQTETSLKQLESKLDKIISKDDTKIFSNEDYSSDEESTYNQDRKGRNTVLSAIKNVRSIVLSEPKPANLNVWLNLAKKDIEYIYPDLKETDLIKVLSHRLPKENYEWIRSEISNCQNFEEFRKMLSNMYGQSNETHCTNYNDIKGFINNNPKLGPKFTTIRQFIIDCLKLSENLRCDEEEKKRLILEKIGSYLPYYFKSILKERYEKYANRNIWFLCEPICSPDSRPDIENHLKNLKINPDSIPINLIENNDKKPTKSEPKKQTEKKQTKKRKDIICRRCGLKNHIAPKCPIYTEYHNAHCEVCFNLVGEKLFHKTCNNEKKN